MTARASRARSSSRSRASSWSSRHSATLVAPTPGGPLRRMTSRTRSDGRFGDAELGGELGAASRSRSPCSSRLSTRYSTIGALGGAGLQPHRAEQGMGVRLDRRPVGQLAGPCRRLPRAGRDRAHRAAGPPRAPADRAVAGVQALERRVGAQLVLDHRLHGGVRQDQHLAERDQGRRHLKAEPGRHGHLERERQRRTSLVEALSGSGRRCPTRCPGSSASGSRPWPSPGSASA